LKRLLVKWALIGSAALGMLMLTRSLVLTKFDCWFCRVLVGFFVAPNDYNAPISITDINAQDAEIFLFPNYIGPHTIEIYGSDLDSTTRIDKITCAPELAVNLLSSEQPAGKVFSKHGHGFILAGLKIDANTIEATNRTACQIRLNRETSGRLIVSRISEY
jgi:hypothetical protein